MAASTRPVHSGFPFPLSHRPRPAPNTHVRTPVGSADVSTPSGDAVVHNCSTSFAHFTRRPPRCRAQPAGRRTGEPSTLTEVLATELRRGRPDLAVVRHVEGVLGGWHGGELHRRGGTHLLGGVAAAGIGRLRGPGWCGPGCLHVLALPMLAWFALLRFEAGIGRT